LPFTVEHLNFFIIIITRSNKTYNNFLMIIFNKPDFIFQLSSVVFKLITILGFGIYLKLIIRAWKLLHLLIFFYVPSLLLNKLH